MADMLEIEFASLSAAPVGTLVVLAGEDLALGSAARGIDERSKGALKKAAAAAGFSGKAKSAIEILAPAGVDTQRIILLGTGKAPNELDRLLLGGAAFAQISARKGEAASILADPADPGQAGADVFAADLAFGALLRSYTFKKYRTKKPPEDGAEGEPARDGLTRLVIQCAKPDAAAKQFQSRKALAEGIFLARDLVNEPANVLGPVEFADRMRELTAAGLEVEVLDEDQLGELKMGALLAVGQGSVRPSRVVVLQWNGAKSKRAKHAVLRRQGRVLRHRRHLHQAGRRHGGHEGRHGRGRLRRRPDARRSPSARPPSTPSACSGSPRTCPPARRTRPGDIITSMSGQTIEVLNTDAEGRLVLADVIWYAQERFKPRFIVDLATLTGAILVALGKEYAGLFCNDDRLAAELFAAGEETGEKVWRMPLGKAYDKLIDSKTADMKNIGGRFGGAITGAQFIQRFVKDTPWAHLDVAGTAMDSNRNEINPSWASGWGVRLLDRLVSDNFEKGEK